MKESKIIEKFKSKILAVYPNCFFYKIPDTFGLGGQRPFDVITIINGVTFCIEFKSANKKATRMQNYYLDLVQQNGAVGYLINEENFNICLEAVELRVREFHRLYSGTKPR